MLLTYTGAKIRITSNFSETMQAGRHGSEIFKVVRKNNTNLEFLTLQNYHLKLKVMNRQSTVDF